MPRKKHRSDGEGTIYQRTDRLWCGQVTVSWDAVTGKQNRKTIYGKSQQEVRDKILELRQEIESGGIRESDLRVNGAVEFWLSLQKTKVAPRAYDRYVLDLKPVKEHLGNFLLSDLSAFQLARWQETLEGLGCSADARRKSLARLRAVLAHAVKLNLVRQNVATMIPLPRHEPEEIHPLDSTQVGLLLRAAAGDRLEALYWIALDTGARQGELFALTWSDWDEASARLSITKTLENREGKLRIKTTKTRASRRTVLLSAQANAMLKKHREKSPEGELIFTAPEGGYLRKENFYDDCWSPLLKKAGLSCRFHDLRHTCATFLLTSGVDLKTVAARLGHASANVTLSIYAHTLSAVQEKAAETIGDFLKPAPAPAPPAGTTPVTAESSNTPQ
jgi:integrase